MQPLSSTPIRVMLISSHQIVLWGLEKFIIGGKPKIEIIAKATTDADALRLAREKQPDVLLLDLYPGNEKCVHLIPAFVKDMHTRVVIFAEMGNHQNTINLVDHAIFSGASGIVYKEDPMQDILRAIDKVHNGELWLKRAITSRLLIKSLHTRGIALTSPDNGKVAALTRRELSIIDAFAAETGAPNKRIAETLYISEQTLRNHLTSIFNKLGITNRFDLFIFARLHHPLNFTNPPPIPSAANLQPAG